MRETEKVFLWIIKIGLWAIPFLPLYVSSSMLFPFITGKNFAFRIIVELIFALWVGLAILRKEYRPRLTPLFKAATIFIGIVFLADLFGANPYRSFFSNYERMEGFMMLGHLYLYFVMLSSVFDRRDWMVFFHTTLIASVLVSYIGLMQKLGYRISLQGGFRVDSTIGNPTYLAAYLLFHIWLLLMLIYQYWQKWWRIGIYGAILIFELAILYFTATRGAILALAATLILLAASLVFFWSRVFPVHPQKRKFAGGILALAIIIPLFFWLIRGTEFVQSSQVLRRLTNYSFQEDTIQARFMIWNMSWQGFKERPVLGWGQENYYLVFQKYYDPGLWDQEPWFDRSHNIVFDWLIHAGILGFLSYLALYGAVFWMLWQGAQRGIFPLWQGLVLAAVFIAHFLQNIFVFDNLNTYLLFFAFLAYGAHLSSPPGELKETRAAVSRQGQAYAVSAVLLIFFFIVAGPFLHYRPIGASKNLIQALQIYQFQGGMDQLIGFFRQALNKNTFGNTEIREQVGNIARSIPANDRFKPEEKQRFIKFAIEEFQKETAIHSKDVKHLLFLGGILNQSADLDPSYPELAKRALEEAHRLSPTKQVIAFELAQHYAATGDGEGAARILYQAWKGDRTYRDASVNLWIIAILMNKIDIINEVASTVNIKKFGEPDLYRIAQAYRQTERYDGAIPVYAELVTLSPDNAQYRATYAALLANAGRMEDAKEQAREAAKLDPEVAKEAEIFLRQLETR